MTTDISGELPAPWRLALAYAPGWTRPAWAGLLLLDRRLGRAALGASEPLLGQVRLAWWRDRFAEPVGAWPKGEPLLALLAAWDRERESLGHLVDGWEAMVGDEGQDGAFAECAQARAQAMIALSRLLGCSGEPVEAAARSWAETDLARQLGLSEHGGATPLQVRLPRPMRPLTLLHDLACRDHLGARALGRMVRLGLFGR
jgi:phytoene synthase